MHSLAFVQQKFDKGSAVEPDLQMSQAANAFRCCWKKPIRSCPKGLSQARYMLQRALRHACMWGGGTPAGRQTITYHAPFVLPWVAVEGEADAAPVRFTALENTNGASGALSFLPLLFGWSRKVLGLRIAFSPSVQSRAY